MTHRFGLALLMCTTAACAAGQSEDEAGDGEEQAALSSTYHYDTPLVCPAGQYEYICWHVSSYCDATVTASLVFKTSDEPDHGPYTVIGRARMSAAPHDSDFVCFYTVEDLTRTMDTPDVSPAVPTNCHGGLPGLAFEVLVDSHGCS